LIRSLGSLGELFPDTDLRCRIRGCNNVWRFSGEDALRQVADGRSGRPERMCDECFRLFQSLQDQPIACSREGCTNTWIWNRFQQLEAARQGRHGPPANALCRDCQQKLREVGDLEVPCRMKGCTRTWTWYARERVQGDPDKPPRRLCAECFNALRDLQDIEVPCRLRGCTHTWTWNRFQQLEHIAGGKPLDRPPRRMCESCFKAFQELKDEVRPCKAKECHGTWTYTAYEQLEQRLAHGAETPPPVPERLCAECYEFVRTAVDREVACRNRGCSNTWTYTRMMQLRMKLKGLHRPPGRTCDACQEKLKALPEREVKCVVPGCSRTWTYSASDQLRDQLNGRIEPPGRRCRECEAFLAEHQSVALACEHCHKPVQWSGYEQLLCELGTFKKPTKCPDCTEQAMALGRPREPERLEHHLIIRVPSAGRWHEDEIIRERPARLTPEVLERMERAAVRVVCIGDELTWSLDDEELSWPYLLQQRLGEIYGGPEKVAVLNAGIAFCTTAQGVVRFPRDVVPFQPHLVVFSFSLADARLYWHRDEQCWRPEHTPEAMMAALERFAECIKRQQCKALYWTPNPIFPQEEPPSREASSSAASPTGRSHDAWFQAQSAALDQAVRVAHQCCSRYGIPALDVRARFEVNGVRSARKWMGSWYLHNEVGSRNMAAWFAEQVVREGLVPPPEAPSAAVE